MEVDSAKQVLESDSLVEEDAVGEQVDSLLS